MRGRITIIGAGIAWAFSYVLPFLGKARRGLVTHGVAQDRRKIALVWSVTARY